MIKYRFVFINKEQARQVLIAARGPVDININKTLADGFIDLYAMDESHAERIATKYNARKALI